MSIRVIAVGKKHLPWVQDAVQTYQKRLRAPFTVEWQLLPHASLKGHEARQEESRRIMGHLKPDDFVVLLDERGTMLSSPQVAAALSAQLDVSAKVVVIIGGAYGVDDTVMARANLVWSLSALVFPHQLVRVIVTEQLYRAQQIRQGGQYHHE